MERVHRNGRVDAFGGDEIESRSVSMETFHTAGEALVLDGLSSIVDGVSGDIQSHDVTTDSAAEEAAEGAPSASDFENESGAIDDARDHFVQLRTKCLIKVLPCHLFVHRCKSKEEKSMRSETDD